MPAASSLRRALTGAALLLTLLPCAAGAAQPGITPLGYVENGPMVDEGPSIAEALSKAPDGAKWVRVFHNWDGTTGGDANGIASLDARVTAFNRAGAKVIVVVTKGGDPVINTADGAAAYAQHMAWLARTFAGRVAVWELWNEPDESFYWPGGPNPGAYTAMLQQAYPAIKAADPTAQVIVGGLVGNDFDFMEALYDNGAKNFFDGVGVHTDTPCRIDAPGVYYREPSGRVGRFAFTGYREVHRTMADHGDADKGIYMTEIGWTAAADLTCDEGVNAGKRDKGVTAAKQAQFLKEAFACTAADPYVKVVSWFTLQDHVPHNRFGLFNHSGEKRPAFEALQSVGDGSGAGSDASCGGKVDRDQPAVTISAPSLYFHRFRTTGTATDPTTPINKIEFWADGKRIMKQDGARYDYDWFGASKIGYGKHTIELRAYDDAGNVGIAQTTIERGKPDGPRTIKAALGLKAKRKGRKIRVKATVAPPTDGSFAEHPVGRLELRFERKGGRKWKRSRVRKGIGSGRVAYTYGVRRPGKWRVYGVLVADAPYRRTKTRTFTFRVR